MGDLLIRNLDEQLVSQIAARASRMGRTTSDEAKDLLQKGLQTTEAAPGQNGMTAFDAMRSIFVQEGALDDEFARIMDEVEAERKRDFGRPPEEPE